VIVAEVDSVAAEEAAAVASATEVASAIEEVQCVTTTATPTAETARDPTKRDFHSKLMISFNQI
jgi:hypothetical protein